MTQYSTMCDVLDALARLTPYEIDRRKVRIGPNRDGGYVYADGITPQHNVLSFGVGYTCEFENELGAMGNTVHMFDPTIDAPNGMHPNCTFHKKGVAAHSSADRVYYSIADALDLAGFRRDRPTILKMDVEGAEFEALGFSTQETLARFEQISVEIHWLTHLGDQGYRAGFVNMLDALNRQFTLFHVHANNCACTTVLSTYHQTSLGPMGALTIAEVLELSFIRNDLIGPRQPNATYYPSEIDFPNSMHWPDHLLTFYPFVPGAERLGVEIRRQMERNERIYAGNVPDAP